MGLEERVAYVSDFGTMDYGSCLDTQDKLKELRRRGKIPDLILFGQHNPVVSFGGRAANNGFTVSFLKQVETAYGNASLSTIVGHLAEMGIKFYDSTGSGNFSRGGGTAYTGPGQLVVYPIIDYTEIAGGSGQRMYKELIDEIMVDTLKRFGIDAKSVRVSDKLPVDSSGKDRRDVWVEKKVPHKIGGKAIRFSGNIASHGFSLYVTKQSILHFDKVLVCGYAPELLGVTSMEHELGIPVDLCNVREKVLSAMSRHFMYDHYEDIDLTNLTDQLVVV